MKSTWLADSAVENTILSTFKRANDNFSMFFENNAKSNEERLTGALCDVLINEGSSINKVLASWSKSLKLPPLYINLYHKDVTVDRKEKDWGADLAFILDAKVPGYYECKKTILLQAKKMETTVIDNRLVFENYWRFDEKQARNLTRLTSSSYYMLYNPVIPGIRILPASTLLAIMTATGNRTMLSLNNVLPATEDFAEFMLYNFIGCWTGDWNKALLKKVEGYTQDDKRTYLSNHIIHVTIGSEGQRRL